MANFSDLSPEVVAQILRFLAPIEILSMRKTCRQCYLVTQLKTVWMTAMDEVCKRHGIFKATYPINEMSLEELERAATSPHRFVTTIKENSARGTVPMCKSRRIQDPSSNQIIDVGSLFLVPGGRFLVTAGWDRVCLWDIGWGMLQGSVKSYPLAALKRPNFRVHAVVPSLDKEELIVAVRSPAGQEGIVEILRINPRSISPVFRVAGRLDLGGRDEYRGGNRSRTVYLTHNTAFIHYQTYLYVWNWTENTGLKFYSPFEDVCGMLYISDTLIVGSDEKRLLTRKSPSPSVFKPLPKNLREMDMAYFDTSYTQRVEEVVQGFFLCSTSIWQQDPSLVSQEYLCLVMEDYVDIDGQSPGISLFSLGQTPGQNEPLLHIERGRSLLSSLSASQIRYAELSLLYKCEDHLVFCSVSNHFSLVATVMPTPGNTDGHYPDLRLQTANLITGHLEWSNEFSFCPMSGRLVHFEPDSGLYIRDYLVKR